MWRNKEEVTSRTNSRRLRSVVVSCRIRTCRFSTVLKVPESFGGGEEVSRGNAERPQKLINEPSRVVRDMLEGGGDLIFRIASGYFGCRDEQGRFSPEKFAQLAADPQIKMIEIS